MAAPLDVVVVGGGMAGTVAAGRLRALGASVLQVDAGPRLAAGQPAPEPDRRLWGFKTTGGSYDWYRVRAVGGRSHQWGGWCFRFSREGFQRAGWPTAARQRVEAAYPAVEKLLRVRTGRVDERYVRAAEELGVSVVARSGAQRSHGVAWNAARTAEGRRVRPHQVALRLEAHRGRATALVVHDLLHERERSLSARAFVLAASPIETARILLGSGLDGARHGIGLNFTDHMVCSLVLLEPRPAPGPAGRGPYPGTALFPSLVNVSRATRRPYRGGFSVEVSGPVHLEKLGLERMVGSAELDRWSATQVHVMGEMFGHPGRRVELDPTARDVIGRPVPRLHVAFSSEEQEMAAEMKQVGAAIADAMAVPGSRIIPFLEPLTAGAGHEAGTCRMGADSAAPCLPTGRLRAFSNAWVADASVMPTSGDRHPTLTVLAHAWAVANSVAQALDV